MLEGFVLSWRVAMRHWEVYKKNFFANILPTAVDPFFYLVVFGYWLGGSVADMNGMPYANYLAPGMVLTTCLYTAFFEASYGFYLRCEFQSVYQAMVTTPVGPIEIIFGEYLWIALKSAVIATITAIILYFAGVVPTVAYFPLIPILGALVGLGVGTIGLLSAGLVANMDQFQTVYALVISPMFFVSGIFFPIDKVPAWIGTLCWISPLYHGVKMGQAAFWGRDVLQTWLVHGSALVVIFAVVSYFAVIKIYPKLAK